MTLRDQMKRAQKGMETAREELRKGRGNDMWIDHWAGRLMFWKDEAKRLHGLSAQADNLGATLAQQYDLTNEGDAA